MARTFLNKCLGQSHDAYQTADHVVYGYPLLGYSDPSTTITPQGAWGMAVEQLLNDPSHYTTTSGAQPSAVLAADPAQALRQRHVQFDEVFDQSSMGMLATATSCDKSFFFEGLEYYDPVSERMQVVTSTQQSNLRSSMEMGMA